MGAADTPRGPAESAAPSRWSRIGTTEPTCGDEESAALWRPPGPARCAAPFNVAGATQCAASLTPAWSRTLSETVVTLTGCGVGVVARGFTLRRCAAIAGVVNGRYLGSRTTPQQPVLLRDSPQHPVTRFFDPSHPLDALGRGPAGRRATPSLATALPTVLWLVPSWTAISSRVIPRW